VSRFRFISEQRATFGVKRLCRVLNVHRSGFYAWLARAEQRADRAAQQVRLVEHIRAIHHDTRGTYGSPRITAELHAHGVVVNHKRVERLMREQEIIGIYLRRRHRTTRRDPVALGAPDLLGRDFTAKRPDTRWVGDITYLRVADRFLYLATVLDLHSRRLIGWSLANHARAELACDALQAAVATRGSKVRGVLFHTDHGTQYTAAAFADVCDHHGVVQSMGRIGDSLDNAAAESFFATLKRELGARWDSLEQARLAVFSWIAFYNYRRRHSTLGYHSPVDYEKITADQQPEAA
jgi:transposase InsO family protein